MSPPFVNGEQFTIFFEFWASNGDERVEVTILCCFIPAVPRGECLLSFIEASLTLPSLRVPCANHYESSILHKAG